MFAGASLDENSGAFCELKANFFRLILTKAELLALTRADFDFENRILSINKTYQVIKGEEMITSPKTEKSNRKIDLPEFLCDEMQDYFESLYKLDDNSRIFQVTKSYLHHEMDRGSRSRELRGFDSMILDIQAVHCLSIWVIHLYRLLSVWGMKVSRLRNAIHICIRPFRKIWQRN